MAVCGQLHVPAALIPWKEPLVPTGQGARWGWRRETIPAPTGNRTPVVQPLTKSLYWLSYPGSSSTGNGLEVTSCYAQLPPTQL